MSLRQVNLLSFGLGFLVTGLLVKIYTLWFMVADSNFAFSGLGESTSREALSQPDPTVPFRQASSCACPCAGLVLTITRRPGRT